MNHLPKSYISCGKKMPKTRNYIDEIYSLNNNELTSFEDQAERHAEPMRRED